MDVNSIVQITVLILLVVILAHMRISDKSVNFFLVVLPIFF